MKRIRELDVLRGIAIAGVGLANVPWFADDTALTSPHATVDAGLDRAIAAWTLALVDGKFIALLAMLFGAGLAILAKKRSPFEPYYMRRSFILIAIGLVHGFLLWYGDILAAYGIVALAAMFMRGLRPRMLLGVGWALVLVGALILGALGALQGGSETETQLGALFSDQSASEFWASAGYFEILRTNAVIYALSLVSMVVFVGPAILGYFCLGMWAMGSGFPDGAWRLPALFASGILGIAVSAVGAYMWWSGAEISGGMIVELGAPFLAVFYALIGSYAIRHLGKVLNPLASIGRLALTSYLTQTVLFLLVFYSWGLGYSGELTRLPSLGVAAIIVLINAAFAIVWLRFALIGPVEWLWRSICDGFRRPLLRRAGADSQL